MSFRSTEQQSTDSWCISCLIYKCSNLLRWPMYQWFLCNMCQDLSSYLCLYLTSIIAYSDIITLIWEIYDFALKSTELSTTPSSNITTPPQNLTSTSLFSLWRLSLSADQGKMCLHVSYEQSICSPNQICSTNTTLSHPSIAP